MAIEGRDDGGGAGDPVLLGRSVEGDGGGGQELGTERIGRREQTAEGPEVGIARAAAGGAIGGHGDVDVALIIGTHGAGHLD